MMGTSVEMSLLLSLLWSTNRDKKKSMDEDFGGENMTSKRNNKHELYEIMYNFVTDFIPTNLSGRLSRKIHDNVFNGF